MMSTLQAGSGRGIEGLEAVRALNFETILDRMEELLSAADPRVLEVGCTKGWFLERAAPGGGMRVEGIEPSPDPDLDADDGGFTFGPATFQKRCAVFRVARRLHRFGLAGLYRRLWQKGRASPHITYFNPRNLRCFVERHTGLDRLPSDASLAFFVKDPHTPPPLSR